MARALRKPELMIRPSLVLSLLFSLSLVPAVAQAQFNVSEIRVSRLDTGALLKDNDLKEFFNMAHCGCETKLQVEARITGFQTSDYAFQVVAGNNCLDPDKKFILSGAAGDCVVLFGPVKANTLTGDIVLIAYNNNPITAKTLMEESCQSVDRESYAITVYTDKDGDAQWEALSTKVEYTVDTAPPDPPKVDADAVKAGEGQATITFKSHTASDADSGISTKDPNFKGYQVLCAEKNTGAPVLTSPPTAEFDAAVNMCGSSCSGLPTPSAGTGDAGSSILIPRAGDAGVTDASLTDAPVSDALVADAFTGEAGPSDAGSSDSGSVVGDAQYCAAFVCSEMQTSPGTITVKGLKNNVSYQFWVMTIDSANNPSSLVEAGSDTPQLVEDLWERYKRQGGQATGGCLISPDDGLLSGWQAGLLGLAVLLGLALFRRRRKREATDHQVPGGQR
jgi:MYXO-CTERM domain-containing protein